MESVKLPLLFLVMVLGVALATTPCQASFWGDPVPQGQWSGSLTSPSGITAGGNWNNANTTISWDVSFDSQDNLYTYEYSWASDDPALSHIIIEVTEGATIGEFMNFVNTGYDDDIKEYTTGGSNPFMPGNLYGIKLEEFSSFPVSFETRRRPVWGNFYAKGGAAGQPNFGYAHNVGFGSTGVDSFYIARPNSIVPIPSALWLLGSGLIGVLGLRGRLSVI